MWSIIFTPGTFLLAGGTAAMIGNGPNQGFEVGAWLAALGCILLGIALLILASVRARRPGAAADSPTTEP